MIVVDVTKCKDGIRLGRCVVAGRQRPINTCEAKERTKNNFSFFRTLTLPSPWRERGLGGSYSSFAPKQPATSGRNFCRQFRPPGNTLVAGHPSPAATDLSFRSDCCEENRLKPSVSVLLPVFNAQHRLENQVAALLDVLAELTDRFDVLIVDDGSPDDTIDVARQLALVYPQVSAVRHPLRLGLAEAVQTGLDQTDGDILFVGDEHAGIDPADLRRLWPLAASVGWSWPDHLPTPTPARRGSQNCWPGRPRTGRVSAACK